MSIHYFACRSMRMVKFNKKSSTGNVNDNIPNMEYNQVLDHINYTNISQETYI